MTPAAYVVSSGQLWFAASRKTVKVRAIRRNPRVSVLVSSSDRGLILAGRAEIVSAWGLADVTNLVGSAVQTGVAATSFALRHLGMLARSTVDFVGDLSLPIDRVLIRMQPSRGIILDGDLVTGRWGRWQPSSNLPQVAIEPVTKIPIKGVPRRAARALKEHRSCAVGWELPWGALVMPGRMRAGGSAVDVPAEIMRLGAADSRSRVCVTLDRGSDRAGKFAGIVVRGDGTVTRRAGEALRIGLTTDRISWWSGFKTGTVWR